ncbi:MAG: Yip1 family protein [Agathobacter rectalis]
MKYCTNCGRQLADDEVCTCRQQAQPQAPNQTQDNNAQADNAAHQAQFNGQPQGNAQGQFNGQPQGQFNGQPQGSAQSQAFDNFTQQVSAAGQQLQNDKNVASIITFYKGLVKKPAQAAADFVKNANMASGFIFIGLFAIVEVVLSVVYLLSSVIGSIGGFGFSFYPASFFEGIFSGIVGEAVKVLILAAVILVVLNAVQKDKKVTFAQTLSAACLYDAVYLPIILVAAIIDIIPFQFFGNVSGWLHTFAGVVGYVSIFFGVRAIEEDDNKLPLVCGLAFLATAIGSTIVNAIF